MSDEPPKTSEILLPDGSVGRFPTADYARLRMLAENEGVPTVEEWFAKHFSDVVSTHASRRNPRRSRV